MPQFDDRRLTVSGLPVLKRMQVRASVADLREAPGAPAQLDTQALHGETLRVFAEEDGFAHVQLDRDSYVGWTPASALSSEVELPTHRVSSLRTHAYCEPDLKSPPNLVLSLGSRLTISSREGSFLRAGTGWVPAPHVVPLSELEGDPAAVAYRFLHTPYLWGGCDSIGLDCTGLTRAAFDACGVSLPRDSDMQFAWTGQPVETWREPGGLKRNDLVFWEGHVGIMLDADTILHANAHHMAVAAEPLPTAIERIAKMYGEPIGARRIDVSSERQRQPDWLAVQA